MVYAATNPPTTLTSTTAMTSHGIQKIKSGSGSTKPSSMMGLKSAAKPASETAVTAMANTDTMNTPL